MLKALIRKQYYESFRSYFVNAKTNKPRSKGGVIGFFVFFGFAMLMLFGIFYSVASMFSVLLSGELKWLYYAMMGLISIALGVFGSVFNTYASLYLPKDNELLLSMPIPSSRILLSRMSLVSGLSLLYSGIVWLPTLVCSWILQTPSAPEVIFSLLLFPVITLFVTAATCILGWVVAAIASRAKRKSFLVVILSIAFFAAYYFVMMRMGGYLEEILLYSAEVGAAVEKWGNLLYQLGRAAAGNVPAMLIFTAVSAVLCGACVFALSKSFIAITTRSDSAAKTPAKAAVVKSTGIGTALLQREGKRFASSPSYILNDGLGIFILPVVTIVFLIKYSALQELLLEFASELPELGTLLPVAVFLIVSMLVSMNTVSTPSVSLEGKSLWILQSLPLRGSDILAAKLRFHVLVSIVPALFAAIILSICMHLAPLTAILTVAALGMFIWLTGSLGLVIGLLNPNVNWTTETVPEKGLSVLLAMLANWIIALAICGLFWLLRNHMSAEAYLAACTGVLAVISLLLRRWLGTKGAERFANI